MRETEQFVLFWSGIYSNWYYSPFVVNGEKYNCVEQYMMEQKARLCGDEKSAEAIMRMTNPAEMKKAGRRVRNFNWNLWDEHKFNVVYTGCHAKFSQNPDLLEEMLATGDKEFVEASPYDKIWGIGLGENDPRAEDKDTWDGQNLLGLVLTKVKNDLRSPK